MTAKRKIFSSTKKIKENEYFNEKKIAKVGEQKEKKHIFTSNYNIQDLLEVEKHLLL